MSNPAHTDTTPRSPSTGDARFTLDGSDALERRLADICGEAAGEVSRLVGGKLEAVVLGGGYGRGEGGVLRTEGKDLPYNDLEFFVLIKGSPRLNERRHHADFHTLEQRLTAKLGIDVEFKITSLARIRDSETTMFFHDLVQGHRVMAGPPDILSCCSHHLDTSRIPAHEAARLLLNRCSGLLYAKERLSRDNFGEAEADFVGRNIAKAKLALGDVVLAAQGRHHGLCQERHRRLLNLDGDAFPCGERLLRWHSEGVDFKLHPVRRKPDWSDLSHEHALISAGAWEVWRWLESRRLGWKGKTPEDYALGGLNKCPETFVLKNLAVSLRSLGLARTLAADPGRYPREILFNSLALLLWDAKNFEKHSPLLARWLGSAGLDWTSMVRAYEQLWRRFN